MDSDTIVAHWASGARTGEQIAGMNNGPGEEQPQRGWIGRCLSQVRTLKAATGGLGATQHWEGEENNDDRRTERGVASWGREGRDSGSGTGPQRAMNSIRLPQMGNGEID